MNYKYWWSKISITLMVLMLSLLCPSTIGRALPKPTTDIPPPASISGSGQPKTPHPAMVAVSSTVIPVSNVKEPSARQSSSNYYFSRRFRFFDKSSKPDEPIRLITKKSSLKALVEASKTT